jgi:hypothetical protein
MNLEAEHEAGCTGFLVSAFLAEIMCYSASSPPGVWRRINLEQFTRASPDERLETMGPGIETSRAALFVERSDRAGPTRPPRKCPSRFTSSLPLAVIITVGHG